MDVIDALTAAYEETVRLTTGLTADRLASMTPCQDWDLRSTIDHLVSATWLFTSANQGKAVDEHVGDRITDDVAAAVAAAALANLTSWRQPGALKGERTYPFGTFPAPAAALINLEEVVVHNWDIAKTTGQVLALDEQSTTLVYEFCRSIPLESFRTRGYFGPEVQIPGPAPIMERLVALLGREP